MRVLHVLHTSGSNPLLTDLIDHLDPSVIKIIVATLDSGDGALRGELATRDVPVIGLRAPEPRNSFQAMMRIRRLMRDLRPDVVQAHLFWPSLAAVTARWVIRRAPKIVVTRHHDLMHHHLQKPIHVRLDSLSGRMADRVVTVSEAVARTVAQLEGIRSEKVTVIHNGIDWTRIDLDPGEAKSWRARFGDVRLLVCAASLKEQKDHATLLRAVAAVVRQGNPVHLALAGGGRAERKRLLANLAHQLGIGDRVEFLGHVENVLPLISAADIYVQSSYHEAFGLSVLEAAGLSVPLAVTTPGGIAEILGEHHPTVPPGDADALASRIENVLKNLANEQALAKSRATEARKRFTAVDMARKHLDLYTELLDRP